MKNIMASVKETLNISRYSVLMYFRERTAVFFSLFIPLMLMGIFGLLNLGGGVKFNVVIVDQAHNSTSKQVVETIKKVEVFNVTEETSKDTALDDLKNSRQTYALILPKDFGANISAGQARRHTSEKSAVQIHPPPRPAKQRKQR
jgi:hypothetical protein